MTLVVRAPEAYDAERRHVLDVVLTEWLGLDHRLVPDAGHRVVIELAGEPGGSRLSLPDVLFANDPEDWLGERSMPVTPLVRLDRPEAASLPVLFGEPGLAGPVWRRTTSGLETAVDLLGSVFFCLTRYEEVVRRSHDRHGRFPAGASLASTEGFLHRPLVDEYVDLLWAGLQTLWPSLVRRPSTFQLQLTHDVDEPWAVLGHGAGAVARTVAGDLIRRRDPSLAFRRLRAVADARAGRVDRDPYDTFDLLMETSERHGLHSVFYFMAATTPDEAGFRYRLSDPPVAALLRRVHDRGHEIGLHASYGSHLSVERMAAELEALRSACRIAGFEQSAWGVRQHFLRFENPRTWRAQEAAGLASDSTLGFADDVGFRAGTCREYPLFDLLERRPLRLRERPLVVMDATLFGYLALGPGEAASRTRAIVAACRRERGDAVVLYHNSTLAEARLAAHYRALVEDLTTGG